MTKEEAEKMRVEAESHSEEDRRRMEEVESRNRLDGIVYQAEKMVRENKDKIAEADAKATEEAIEDAKKAMAEGGNARLRSATKFLTIRSSSEWKATTTTRPAGLSTRSAAARPWANSASSSLTKMRSA